TDSTLDYLSHVTLPYKLCALSQENQGAAAARNRGLQAAQGDIVLFIDDDIIPAPTLLAEHVRMHRGRSGNIVVLGPMLTPLDFDMAPWVRWEQAMLVKQYDGMANNLWQPTARQFYIGNASVERSHLLAVRGFDPMFRRAEDVELAYRLHRRGLTFHFNPDAIGYHYAERTFTSWLRTPYEYGRNGVVFAESRGQPWLLELALQEFSTRHWLIYIVVYTCLSRSLLTRYTLKALRTIAALATANGQERIANHAYSAIFNLRYYQGMADELGGRRQFVERLAQEPTYKPFFRSLLTG
ncbi:MAG: glycosyltransferase, partial [Caldilineaceae bacterium]|nr:glycosyltransferase [Caldilineaceae bacterium]